MSERKVLNKYYPPDFDPAKIPRMRMPKNRKFCVRLMAPCNMRCDTCGEYIYKGKKFNARKEDVDNLSYLGIRIYRFYIKCTRCLSEISFRTDPENTDYVLEAGATRNFQALKLAEEAAEREEAARLEEEKNNPMKLLEKRTQQSKYEMDMLETLEELKELNQRQGSSLEESLDVMLLRKAREAMTEQDADELEDEAVIESIYGPKMSDGKRIVRLAESDESDEEQGVKPAKRVKSENPKGVTEAKPSGSLVRSKEAQAAWEKSLGTLGGSKKLAKNVLVKPKNALVKPSALVVVKKEPGEQTASGSCSSASSSPPLPPVTASPMPEIVVTVKEERQEPPKEEVEQSPIVGPMYDLPHVEVPVVAESFAKGLAAATGGPSSSSGSSAKSGPVRGTFYNPFGAYGSGSSSEGDSD